MRTAGPILGVSILYLTDNNKAHLTLRFLQDALHPDIFFYIQ